MLTFCLQDYEYFAPNYSFSSPVDILAISRNSGGSAFRFVKSTKVGNLTVFNDISSDGAFLFLKEPKYEDINRVLNTIKERLSGDYLIQFSIKDFSDKSKIENIKISFLKNEKRKPSVNLFHQKEFYIENH